MALGVQIKTGEDPPTGEISISGYDKKKKLQEKFTKEVEKMKTDLKSPVISSMMQKGPRSEIHKQIPENLTDQINKPVQNNAYREQHDFKRGNHERKEEDRRYRRGEVRERRRRSSERDSRQNR